MSCRDEDVAARIKERISQEKPWDRVKLFFMKDPSINRRYAEGLWTDYCSGVLALMAGSYMFAKFGRYGQANYLKANQVTAYLSRKGAKRTAIDAYAISGMKRGLATAVVTYAGAYTFIGGAQIIELYRGKSNPMHYTLPAMLIGLISRFVYGPRHMLVGSIIGGIVGTQCGILIVWPQQLCGLTMEERHFQRIKAEFTDGLLPHQLKSMEKSLSRVPVASSAISAVEHGMDGS